MKKAKLAPIRVPKKEPEPVRIDIGSGKNPKAGFIGIDILDFGQDYICDFSKPIWYPKPNGKLEAGKLKMHSIPPFLDGSVKGLVGLTNLMFKANSVDEVNSSHFVEHLTGAERISFFNELYRVMKPGAVATIVTPNWSHACAYGDPTHQWPPMSQWFPLYLNKEWRDSQAPHVPYTCDFNHTIAGAWDAAIEGRNPEYKQAAMQTQTNAWRDLIVTLTKK